MTALIHSPMIPQHRHGTEYTELMHVTDWFPTILDMAEIPFSPRSGFNLDGVSHRDPLLYGLHFTPRSDLLYNYYLNVQDSDPQKWQNVPLAIRDDRFKLIHAYVGNPTSAYYTTDDTAAEDGDDDKVPGGWSLLGRPCFVSVKITFICCNRFSRLYAP